jgi:hypothetical protein
VFTFVHWTTSFLGVCIIGGSQPAQLLGRPSLIGAATSLPEGGVDPWNTSQ